MGVAKCQICEGPGVIPKTRARDYLSGDEFNVVQCESCSLCFVSPSPCPQEMEKYYPPFYYGNRRSFYEQVTCYLRARRVERLVKNKGRRAVLDVGCGKGGMLQILKRKGWEVLGTEFGLRPRVEGQASMDVPIEYSSLKDCHIPSDRFDVVTLWHVLEHLPNPRETLQEIWRILKKDGILIISVPNYESIQAKIAGFHWFHLDVPRHLFHFNPKALCMLLEKEGFQIEEKQNVSFEYDIFGFVQSVLNLLTPRQNLLFDLLNHRWSIPEILEAKIDGGLRPFRDKKNKGGMAFMVTFFVTLFLSFPLFLVALIFCVFEGMLGYGGTIGWAARKRDHQAP